MPHVTTSLERPARPAHATRARAARAHHDQQPRPKIVTSAAGCRSRATARKVLYAHRRLGVPGAEPGHPHRRSARRGVDESAGRCARSTRRKYVADEPQGRRARTHRRAGRRCLMSQTKRPAPQRGNRPSPKHQHRANGYHHNSGDYRHQAPTAEERRENKLIEELRDLGYCIAVSCLVVAIP